MAEYASILLTTDCRNATRLPKNILTRPNKGLPIDEGWFDEFEESGFTIYGPTDIKLVEQTDEKQIVKALLLFIPNKQAFFNKKIYKN